MKERDYFKKLSVIEDEHRERIKKLDTAYVKKHSKFKIGDTITDGRNTIIIDGISALVHDRFIPEAYYRGVYLTSRGKCNAKGYHCSVYGNEAKLVKKAVA